MPDTTPSVYLFYGDDDFTMNESVVELRSRLGESPSAELNFDKFDGTSFDFSQFHAACYALPFLASRRMVVLDSCERLPQNKDFWVKLQSCLESLPESTALILLENVEVYQNKRRDFFKDSKLWNWSQDQPEGVYTRGFFKPKGQNFQGWIQERTQASGGSIEPGAAQLLSSFVEEDPRLAAQEITKLLDYVDHGRRIERSDVELLSTSHSETNIFALVDALGNKDLRSAMGMLKKSQEQMDIGRVFSMIVRHFRLLLLTREALDLDLDPRDRLPTRTPDFVREKLIRQARNFDFQDLKRSHRALLQLDIANKTGRVDLSTGLDLFVLDLVDPTTKATNKPIHSS